MIVEMRDDDDDATAAASSGVKKITCTHSSTCKNEDEACCCSSCCRLCCCKGHAMPEHRLARDDALDIAGGESCGSSSWRDMRIDVHALLLALIRLLRAGFKLIITSSSSRRS